MAHSMDGSTAVATIRDLEVSFETPRRRVGALRGVSLEIQAGEVVAVVGESGSGKSCLGLSLLGLIDEAPNVRTSGTVQVLGQEMLRPGAGRQRVQRTELGVVFQDPLGSLNPTMRIGRQLTERGVSEKNVIDNLAEAGVPHPKLRFGQYPHELSGGLRQRAMIAMALGARARGAHVGEAGRPLLIVADEPTTALDVSVQAQVLLLFDRLRREHGCGLMLITHDLAVAAAIADRIVVMSAGRICEQGTSDVVLRDPQHAYTRSLIRARIPGPRERARPRARRAAPDQEPRAQCKAGRPVLELEGVTKAFLRKDERRPWRRERVRVVADVSLRLAEGGSLALVGESGSGKTTTLRMACGLLQPDAGRVRYESGRSQLVFQDAASSLTPWRTVQGLLDESLAQRGLSRVNRRARARELLDAVGLDADVARAKGRELSGGQRQRAAIARALASDPSLLLCDEPVSALDASLTVRILDLLQKVRESFGVALLVVTHDLAAASYVADDIAVMYAGRIVETGPVEEVVRNPRHPYTEALLASVPTMEPRQFAPTLPGEPPSGAEGDGSCAFADRCRYARPDCTRLVPPLRPVGPQHSSACLFADNFVGSREATSDLTRPTHHYSV